MKTQTSRSGEITRMRVPIVLGRVGRSRTDAVHDARVALRDLGLALDDEAGLQVMLVPEVHLGAGVDGRLGQREAEAVVTHQEPLRAPVLPRTSRSVPS